MKDWINRLLMAASILFTVLIPVIYIYNTFLHPHKLVLEKKSYDVIIKKNHVTLLLAPGDYLNEGYDLKTGEKSACTIQYARKSTIAMDEKAEMTITEFSKNKILLGLDAGEIHVKENKNDGATVHVSTPLAAVHAIGTGYSVKHLADDMETTVKVVEGLVHIKTIPREDEIMVKEGEEAIIRQDTAPVKRESRPSGEEEWHINTLYAESSVKKAITGFDRYGEIVIGGTEQSLVCFTGNKILWEYSDENTHFISSPVIFNNIVYIPAGKNILRFDLLTGIKESGIETRDTIKSGHNFIHYKNNLYIVFASGIYLYDDKKGSINTEPLIPVIDAALPVFYANTIYVASYITSSLYAFDLSGGKVWSLPLNDRGICSPVAANNVILAGTRSGTLYKITMEGMIENKLQLNENILSIIYGNDRVIFVLTGEGKFYEINLHAFDIERVYYKVNTGIVYNNNVIMGMAGGAIKIMDIQSKKELEIPLPYSEASAFTGYDDSFFAGLKNGCILLIKK